ncbi:helix-turn-helix domain-containing protein [Streptomyces heilongjiangensis]|uniref:DUF2690 domain-containing protein n=1 Tax=Streptomyces heilongjiangensis TaxID=945052 RepID=A0ABW1B9F8_9ACTN|nr:XRE family transcriptional regulator [Streptomyces heilongjiangensis]MDC2947174.1 DUF2690 domain-containing protein [Streptomyces heilongjiangensis]
MPRWRALPDELDPQVKEFASQLRRLVDRGGLSVAAVADRTGYSKTSWERYLNGRLLAPKGAIVALAEVTGTNPVHLTTMWELAERAWSRSEMRHDMTMEAIRISQARAALGETGGQAIVKGGQNARAAGRSATVTPGIAGPAGVSPTVPPQPRGPAEERTTRPPYGSSAPSSSTSSAASSSASSSSSRYGGGGAGTAASPPRVNWGAASPSSVSSGSSASSVSSVSSARAGGGAETPSGVFGPPPGDAGRPDDGASGAGRRVSMFLAGAVGALVVIAAAFFLTQGDGGGEAEGTSPANASTGVGTEPGLPAGVKCAGTGCTGKDPEAMGCTAGVVKTADEATVGTARVEVRYSETCRAAWARITLATRGDKVRVTAGKVKQTAAIEEAGDNIAYTSMVAVKDAGDAEACVTLASGEEGCTR